MGWCRPTSKVGLAMNLYAKAIIAGLTTFVATYGGSVLDSSPGGEVTTSNEWVLIAVGTVISLVAVWAVPNKPTPGV
jgi:hypothetical protein